MLPCARMVWSFLVFVCLVLLSGSASAQFLTSPQPGDVYREFNTTINHSNKDFRVTDPGALNSAAQQYKPNSVLSIAISDTVGAIRAEVLIDTWSGHIGTTNKRFRFNSNAWITIPELGAASGIPAGTSGQCYYSQSNPVISIPLSHLRQGTNTFEGTSGGQTCFAFNWGMWNWYGIVVRVYYDSNKPRPGGQITSPMAGETIFENTQVTASATSPVGINRIDFLASYEGYDVDGDGVYGGYQHYYHRGKNETQMLIKGHVGTSLFPPYQVTWNTDLVPDQTPGSVKLVARILDNNGIWFVTNEVSALTLRRDSVSVKMYKAAGVPQQYNVRTGRPTKTNTFTIPTADNLTRALSATFLVATWNGIDGHANAGETHYTRINSYTTARFGEDHFYSFDVLPIPTSALRTGSNTVTFYSTSTAHGRDVMWPGPAVIVRYNTLPPTPARIVTGPQSQSIPLGQKATFGVTTTGSAPIQFQWQRNNANISGATSGTYTTPTLALSDNGASYRVIVSNTAGRDTSAPAILTVFAIPPTITRHPATQTVQSGQTATFFVRATGSPTLSYQWQKNGVNIAGATTAWYTTPTTTAADNGAGYRCVITNAGGTATSNAAILSLSATTPPSMIVSDDFNSTTLNSSLWSFIDPVGDATLLMTGTGSQDARLSLSIPAGTSHDVWSSGNLAPRIMQPANNTNFDIRAKFETTLVSQFQLMGIQVEQNATNFIRFDFMRRTSGYFAFSATFSGNTPTIRNDISIPGGNPLFMRVLRVGNQWTFSHSTNGTTWTSAATFSYTMSVGAVGPFIGNAGSPPPQFTGLVDYFFNAASPISPEDGAPSPPFIVVQPTNQNAITGDQVTLSLTTSGSLPLQHQWQLNGADIPGATSTSYTINRVSLSDNGGVYRCVVTNASGTIISDAVTLTVLPHPSGIKSDDFNAYSLNTSLWTFVNPYGDATLGFTGVNTSDARLRLNIPGGVTHDAWGLGNSSVRIIQPATNSDFELETKIESEFSTAFQSQGILIQQSPDNYMRFDFTRKASGTTNMFVATLAGSVPSIKNDAPISGTGPHYLRVRRQGAVWSYSWSRDGVNWTSGSSFSHSINVSSVGLFAGNAGEPPPAFSALFDYFFLTAEPIEPEDGGTAIDSFPPLIANITPLPASTGFAVEWTTDEPATGVLQYGVTTGYELGSVTHSDFRTFHRLEVADIHPGTVYYFRVISADAAGNSSTSSNGQLTTSMPTPPQINIWFGRNQNFGQIGNPQPYINILGNVSDQHGVISLSYSLNGGAEVSLSMGPDSRRLWQRGDFNIDILTTSLQSGANSVIITATDGEYTVGRDTVTVNYTPGNSWPRTYLVDWNTVPSVQSAVQVVDGNWTISNGQLRTTQVGYDRLIAIGEQTWDDYEITVPVTIHSIDSLGKQSPSNGAAVGFLLRWPGHSDLPPSTSGMQPKTGFLPLGALSWYHLDPGGLPRFRIIGNNLSTLAEDVSGSTLTLGVRYVFKMRVETVIGVGPRYSMKVWPQSQPEPTTWNLRGTGSFSDPQRGCVLLVAHHMDISFGNVTVVPLSIPSTITSDDFQRDTLNTSLWTFVNPRNDATYEIQGSGTLDARLALVVPGGIKHEPWSPSNTAVRAMQPANNTSFEVEAKFDSPLANQVQMHGVLVEQDANNFIRFDFSTSGSSTKLFSGTAINGVYTPRYNVNITGTPPYMRVRREGDLWTMMYSFDGTSWATAASFVQNLTVTSVGPFAGNAGSNPPQYTALVDYFFNTTFPISPEDAGGGGFATRIMTHPQGQTVVAGDSVRLSVLALGTPPLAYQWQRNSVNISGATAANYAFKTSSVIADSGSRFRCIVSNPFSADTSITATLHVQYVPSTIVSDDFRSGTLNTSVWRFVNPLNDGSIGFSGVGTQDAVLRISVPGGTPHDIWTSGSLAPRIMQKMNDTNLDVEVKFQSGISNVFEFHGVMIQQTNRDFVRFGFTPHATSNWTRLFAASFVNQVPTTHVNLNIVPKGVTPLWLRVKRYGNTWTVWWSQNGTSWTNGGSFNHTLVADSIGIYAGNASSPAPAYTSHIDYFFNLDSPIVPEDGVPPSITSHPISTSVIEGQRAVFSVAVSGSGPLTYQWQKNGANILGATGPSYTTQPVSISDNGNTYRVLVGNVYGSLTSNVATLGVSPGVALPWWGNAWRFRLPVEIRANGFERRNKPVEFAVDFSSALSSLGELGTFDEQSLRIVEVDSEHNPIDTLVVFQFDKDGDYNPSSKATGTMILLMNGVTASNATRYYHIYYETVGNSYPAFSLTPRVTITDTASYQGQESFKIVTTGGTLYYHKRGAGFASYIDPGGNDWISYRPEGGHAGEFRGIPNLGDVFHPGYTNSNSVRLSSGLLRARIRSTSTTGQWECVWDIFPNYARMVLTRKPTAYWWLYEGTPGGSLDVATDFCYRSNGARNALSASWSGDIPGDDWAYFGDAALNRVLYAVHHDPNNVNDYYSPGAGLMTVFGFGRKDPCCIRYIDEAPQTFTFGFAEDSTFTEASKIIRSAYKDVQVVQRDPHLVGTSGLPVLSNIVSDNFNSVSLNSNLWTYYNPLGDASLTMTGSQLRITIPAGTSHDLWTGGNFAPRVMQPANNANFEVEAKFQSTMNTRFQIQGILVQEDPTNLVRFDFVRGFTDVKVFAATFVNGVPTTRIDSVIVWGNPTYLRVTRQGNKWTQKFSTDGNTWITAGTFYHQLVVTSIGPFFGTAGTAPPLFTGVVDYFFNTEVPLFSTGSFAGGVEPEEPVALATPVPDEFFLLANYPNPFNPSTRIEYGIPEPATVSVKVYNMLGQEIATLADGALNAGYFSTVWNGTNSNGMPVGSGMFIYRMVANGASGKTYSNIRKMMLMR